MTDKSPFNRWFGDTLRRRTLTYMDAAWELGVHVSTVAKWAGGFAATPGYDQLVRIVAAFGELPPEIVSALRRHGLAIAPFDGDRRTSDSDGNGPAEGPPPIAGPPEAPPISTGGVHHRPGRRASA